METVIPPNRTSGHVIQKYHFKVLTAGVKDQEAGNCQQAPRVEMADDGAPSMDDVPPVDAADQAEAAAPIPNRDEVIEQMLKKADELSSNLVKMQMQLEKQQEEFERRLVEERERALEEGRNEGLAQCRQEVEQEIESMRQRLREAVSALDESRQTFLQKVDTIEEELIETALDLAKQVIAKEVERDSKEVALRLSRLLLAEIKDATEVTLKLHPDDADYVRENLKEPHIRIEADNAVGKGGVVIVSDVGRIDGEIMQRFERIKEAVFGNG
jgi:flagellar assembly protein FliH